MRLAATLSLSLSLFAAAPVFAAPEVPFPQRFGVTGVAVGDVLNIRVQPDASAVIIGGLAPDATGIEAITSRDGWLKVNLGEGVGWVNGRYAAVDGGLWQAPDALPSGLTCFGTEPFWSLTLEGDEAVWSTPDGGHRHPQAQVLARSWGWAETPERVISAEGLTAFLTGADDPALCSDGMSDRQFGLNATVVLRDGGPAQHYHGCCSVGAQADQTARP